MKDAKDLENRIFTEQVSMLFKQYPTAALTGSLVSLLVVFVIWEHVPRPILLGWLVLQNIALLAGYVLAVSYRKECRTDDDHYFWFRRYLIIIATVALFWGSVAIFLEFNLQPLSQIFIIIFVVGVASSALVFTIQNLYAYFIFLSVTILPVVIWLIVQPERMLNGIAGLGILFFFLLASAGRRLNQSLVGMLRLRFEKDDLANEVRQLNENLEQRVIEKTQALTESEERFDLAMQGANDGLWDWDIRGHSAYFSPMWKTMLGFQDWEISASPREWRRRIHRDDLRKVLLQLSSHLQGNS
ncbi:MAG: hypothetical protein V3R65_08415, partial [Acidiferrobacterales bacterium]